MPANKALYPKDWPQIAAAIKEESDWCCQDCGKQCYRPTDGVWTVDHRRVLTVHHKDHDPANCARDNLIALCTPCHLRADAEYHAKNAAQTRRQKKIEQGQMEMVL